MDHCQDCLRWETSSRTGVCQRTGYARIRSVPPWLLTFPGVTWPPPKYVVERPANGLRPGGDAAHPRATCAHAQDRCFLTQHNPACPSMSQHVPMSVFPRLPFYPPMAARALSCSVPRPHHSSRAGFLPEHADLLAVGKRLLDGVYCCHRRERSIPSHWQSAVGCRKVLRDDDDLAGSPTRARWRFSGCSAACIGWAT